MDVFKGLGNEKVRGTPRTPFIGLGKMHAEVVSITVKPGQRNARHMIFRAEFINRKTIDEVTPAMAAELNNAVKIAKPDQKYSYAPTNPEGSNMCLVLNLTTSEYAMSDVRDLMGALLPTVLPTLADEEKANLQAAIADETRDEWSEFANLVTAGDGQRFAGAVIEVTGRHSSKYTEGAVFTNTYFSKIEASAA